MKKQILLDLFYILLYVFYETQVNDIFMLLLETGDIIVDKICTCT